MIKKSDILADMHTHTIFSGHAYSTIKENIDEAKNCGLSYLVISDHYYNDGTDINKKNETTRLRYMEERLNHNENCIKIIGSAEFNLGQNIFELQKLNLKWRPIGLHSWFVNIKESTLDDIYELFKKAAIDGHNCFVHIERELHKLNYGKEILDYKGEPISLNSNIKLWLEAICNLAKKYNIYLEVNESSIITNEGYSLDRLRYWLKYAKKNQNLISLGTDAHYCMEVGKFDNVIKLLNEIDYPKELILNCNENLLNQL